MSSEEPKTEGTAVMDMVRSQSILQRVIATALALVVCAAWATAQEPEALVGGRKAKFKDRPGDTKDLASVTFANDTGLWSFEPVASCDDSSMGAFVRFSTSEQTNARVGLPCENWTASGSGFRYRDRSGSHGGIQRVIYKFGKLSIKAKGPNYTPPIAGPVTFAEIRLDVGEKSYCGRFETFKKNDATQVRATRPSQPCEVTCGDAIAEGGEQCDDGNLEEGDGCDTNCTLTGCGNSIQTPGEDCDDGNTADGDGCRADCTLELCGDAILDVGEECDDGNTQDGDCCSAGCLFEDRLPCSDGNLCTTGDACLAGQCTGSPMPPWINEFDYDSYDPGGPNNDRDEFVEIAAWTGTDLGGYKIMAIEGNSNTLGSPCLTGFGAITGNAHFTAEIPQGTIVGDDTGTGIGFLVVCFTYSSTNLTADCDVILPAPANDSNLKNGHLTNGNLSACPDGILLVDPQYNLLDAISYEGLVGNAGTWGPFFNPPNSSYSAPRDTGWTPGVSVEKISDQLGRATSAEDWLVTGSCTDQWVFGLTFADPDCVQHSATPGTLNAGQTLTCGTPWSCGDSEVNIGEQCDEGDDNSDEPDATCRVNCLPRRCGDKIVDPGFGEQCERDTDCGEFYVCLDCVCENISICGNGVIDHDEGCDDFNTDDGDGCSRFCEVEEGWECVGEPSDCTELCGNGVLNQGEECDAGVDNSDEPDAPCRTDCTSPDCGDGIVDPGLGEQCDDGENNSNAANANCRTTCLLAGCGDGILDPGFGEQCDGSDLYCAPGGTCDLGSCLCLGGTPLGLLTFTVVDGPGALDPPDDGESSILRLTPVVALGIITVSNGTNGQWAAVSQEIKLWGGVPDGNGVASLHLLGETFVGAPLPDLAGEGKVCYRLLQDPSNTGFVDCDGGSNVDVNLTMDSNGTGENGPLVLSLPGGADSGAGAATIRVLMQAGAAYDASIDCPSADYSQDGNPSPVVESAFTTGVATSTILNAVQQNGSIATSVVVQSGQPFDCDNWTADAGASVAAPNVNADVFMPDPLGVTMDVCQGIRLNDD